MKVICIDANGLSDYGCQTSLEEGIVYNAEQSETYKDCYRLAEIPRNEKGQKIHFRKYRFIPLSNIDETELVNQIAETY